jgi:acylglycerol lipase
MGLKRWLPEEEPTVVVAALHGMNDYSNAFHFAAPVWAQQGIATYAYDQRGFGRSPRSGGLGRRGADDRRPASVRRALLRQRAPGRAALVVAGESMGGAVAIAAFASRPAAGRRPASS